MNVVQAISEVAKAVGPIYKDRSAQGYNYRGIEDMMNGLSLPLREAGVVIVPHVDVVEHHDEPQGKKPGWVRVVVQATYTIYGPEGDSIIARVSADALDNSDKAHGKALSYCFKSLVGQLFCIPTEDDNEEYDAGDHDDEPVKKSSAKKDDGPKLPVAVTKILDEARGKFKALDADAQANVKRDWDQEFDFPMKEIEKKDEAEFLLLLVDELTNEEEAAGTVQEISTDKIREMIDDLTKEELVEFATICADNDMNSGEPDSWTPEQVGTALDFLEADPTE